MYLYSSSQNSYPIHHVYQFSLASIIDTLYDRTQVQQETIIGPISPIVSILTKLFFFSVHFFYLQQIFRPLTEHFDVTIKLRDKLNVKRHQCVDGTSDFTCVQPRGETTSKRPMPVVDFNVFRIFLNDLKVLNTKRNVH